MKIEDAFTKLLNRQATDEERLNLYRVRDTLGLADNDALWQMMLALEYYKTLYATMPALIANEVNGILVNARVTAEKEMMGTAVKIHGELVQSVANTAKDVAIATSGKSMAQWAIGCVAGTVLFFGLFGWWMHSTGYDAGKADVINGAAWMTTEVGNAAYKAVERDKEIAEWMGTSDAQRAFKMSKSGELKAVMDCSREGWEIVKQSDGQKLCAPKAGKKHLFGWMIP